MSIAADDRNAIADLLTEFSWRVDHGHSAEVAGLFVESGTITTPMFSLTGRADIARHFTARDAGGAIVSRHLWFNLRLARLDARRVRAETVVQTYLAQRRDAAPAAPDHYMVGDSIDVVEQGEDGCWRFVERHLVVAFRAVTDHAAAPGSPAAPR